MYEVGRRRGWVGSVGVKMLKGGREVTVIFHNGQTTKYINYESKRHKGIKINTV